MDGFAGAKRGEGSTGLESDGQSEGIWGVMWRGGAAHAVKEAEGFRPLAGAGVGAEDGVPEEGVWMGYFIE